MIKILLWMSYFISACLSFLILFHLLEDKLKLEHIFISILMSVTGFGGVLLCAIIVFVGIDKKGTPLKQKFVSHWISNASNR